MAVTPPGDRAGDRTTAGAVRVAIVLGLTAVASVVLWSLDAVAFAPVVGWSIGAGTYLVVVWWRIGRLDAAGTATHATREDPTRVVADLILVAASIASLGAVVLLLVRPASAGEAVARAALAVLSLAVSWALVHTLYTLRYARLYYSGQNGGVDFNSADPPRYSDFAYLSFTLGMTYQVSDTAISDPSIRATVLRHTLLSYLFGAVILAAVINLVVGL